MIKETIHEPGTRKGLICLRLQSHDQGRATARRAATRAMARRSGPGRPKRRRGDGAARPGNRGDRRGERRGRPACRRPRPPVPPRRRDAPPLRLRLGGVLGVVPRAPPRRAARRSRHGRRLPLRGGRDAVARRPGPPRRRDRRAAPAGRPSLPDRGPGRPRRAEGGPGCQRCPGNLAGLRDRALLLLAAAGLYGERLLSLDREHVRLTAQGAELAVRGGGQAARERLELARGAAAASCPVRALERWLDSSDTRFGPVFRKVDRWGAAEHGRLRPDGLRRILRSRAKTLASRRAEDS